MVAITDPERGSLRERASREGWRTLPIPSNVGGRFSVLTAAGLLPAALAGIDVEGLRRGAQTMAERCKNPVLRQNPAGVLAAVCHLHHELRGRSVHVLMPYGDRLRAFAAWYVQLWAESLGKRHDRAGQRVETGPTALPAVGATDQHAQMQLFMEGPRDKLITFVAIEEREPDLRIPESDGSEAYLAGRTLGELLAAEREGTTEALASDGRPSLTVSLPRLDAGQLGALLFLYQAATAFAGELYDVDAFDQPGVELGKRLAFASLGRSGYEQEAAQLQSRKASRNRNYSL
jgi:glucose-6-phosphate isomerase